MKSRNCYCALKPSSSIPTTKPSSIQKSCIPIFEQIPIPIPSKRQKEKILNLNDSFDYASVSSNSDLSFHTPLESVETWLTFKTNQLDLLSRQLSPKKETNKKCIDGSEFNSNKEPIQIIYDGIFPLRNETLKKHINVSSGYKGVVNLDPYVNKGNCLYLILNTYSLFI